jgi:hypothetical protein
MAKRSAKPAGRKAKPKVVKTRTPETGQAVRQPRRRQTASKIPAEQGLGPKSGSVGYGKPPVEHQFPPGVSGNPDGTPRSRSNLWRHFCRWLEMSPTQLAEAAKDKKLTMAERAAIKQVRQLVAKGLAGTAWLATREAWNRDEGKPTEHVRIDQEQALSEEECEEIRRLMGQGR